jgi:hypothetical protein
MTAAYKALYNPTSLKEDDMWSFCWHQWEYKIYDSIITERARHEHGKLLAAWLELNHLQ